MNAPRSIAHVLSALMLVACSESAPEAQAGAVVAQAVAHHECAVCGMVVAEQPAPRAQVVHRDGTRLFFCSQGDLMSHLQAPSPHGEVTATFVEVLDPAVPLEDVGKGPHTWVRAEAARFLLGRARPGIMGEPVLVYAADAADSADRARGEGEQVLSFQELADHWAARR